MINTTDAVLEQAPKAINATSVRIAVNVDPLGMVDSPVDVAMLRKIVVSEGFIREDHARGKHALLNHRNETVLREVVHLPCVDVPLALQDPGNHSLSYRPATL